MFEGTVELSWVGLEGVTVWLDGIVVLLEVFLGEVWLADVVSFMGIVSLI